MIGPIAGLVVSQVMGRPVTVKKGLRRRAQPDLPTASRNGPIMDLIARERPNCNKMRRRCLRFELLLEFDHIRFRSGHDAQRRSILEAS